MCLKTKNVYKKIFLDRYYHYCVLSLSPEESKEIVELLAQKRGIKDYESMSSDRLLSAIISSTPVRKGKKPKISKGRI